MFETETEAAGGGAAGVREADGGFLAPARRADEHVGGESGAGGEVHHVVGETLDVGGVHAHGACAEQVEEVLVVVVDAEGAAGPEGGVPGLELLQFGVRVVAVGGEDFAAESGPEFVDEEAPCCGAL
jgi:hypothetical protein